VIAAGLALCLQDRLQAQDRVRVDVAGPAMPHALLGAPTAEDELAAELPPPTPMAAPQDKKDDQQKPPALPPTKVEGTPTPPTTQDQQPQPPNTQPPPPTTTGTSSLAAGGVFGAPAVNGYRADSTTTGTKVNIPLIDYPGSIGSATQDTIRDQQALSVEDLLRDFGATAPTFDPRRDSLNVRGFEVLDRDIRWNGFLDPFTPFRDLGNIQQIELLKGPASFLYGANQPGGILNYITKSPTANGFTDFTVTGGSYGLFRTTIDSNGAIDPDGNFLFRLNAAYTHSDSFRNFGFDERTLVAPVFTWIIDPDTYFKVEAQYTNDRRDFDTGLVAINGQIINVPRSTYLNQPGDLDRENDYKFAATLYHQFDECWAGRIGGFVTWLDAPSDGTAPFMMIPGLTPATFGLPPTTIFRQEEDLSFRHEQYYSIIADLNGKFNTGSISHNLLVGTELGYLNSQEQAFTSDPFQPVPFEIPPFPPVLVPFPSSPLNYENPNYNVPPAPLTGSFSSHLEQQRYGFYLQDMIDLNENWKLLAGVREDIVLQNFSNGLNSFVAGDPTGSFPFTESAEQYYHTSPRVGLLFQPIPKVLSFYATYALSFDPPVSGVFANPQDIKPETGQIVEGGMRADLLNNHLTVTVAGFYITKHNVSEQDPTTVLPIIIQVGEERSQGVELGAVGKLTDWWSIIANYAYVDARTLSDADPDFVGQRLPNAPFNNLNIWSRVNLIDDGCQVFGVGLGFVWQSSRPGDLADSFSMGSFTRWDAGLFYSRGHLSANLYFENIFDVHYFSGSEDTALAINPGAPFNMRATVGVKF
jgi:iron complex outermembrane recepter protein